jgi:hypothetical protein
LQHLQATVLVVVVVDVNCDGDDPKRGIRTRPPNRAQFVAVAAHGHFNVNVQ